MKTWKILLAACMLMGLTAACDDDEPTPVVDPPTPTVAKLDSTELWCERDGQRIYGRLYTKCAEGERVPAVILAHSSSLTHAAMSGYARQLAERGMAAYCFDFCGGSKDSKSDGNTADMTPFTELADLRAVLHTVRTLPCVEADSVYLMGSSLGGFVSALLAEEEPDLVRGLILFYPAFNMPDLVRQFASIGSGSWGDMGDAFGGSWGSWGDLGGSWGDMGSWGDLMGSMQMSEAFINSLKDYDTWSHIGTYARPVLMVHGTKDIIVPISNSEKAVGLYPDAELVKIEGANHGFNAANLGSMGSLMGGGTANYDSEVMPHVFRFVKR